MPKHSRHAPLRKQREGENFAMSRSLHLIKRTTHAFKSLSQYSRLSLSLLNFFSNVLKLNKEGICQLIYFVSLWTTEKGLVICNLDTTHYFHRTLTSYCYKVPRAHKGVQATWTASSRPAIKILKGKINSAKDHTTLKGSKWVRR